MTTQTPEIPEITVSQARQLIAARFEDDPGFYQGYLSVVAMMLNDNYNITDHHLRNSMARDMLEVLFLVH